MRADIWSYLFDEGFLPQGTCLPWDSIPFWTLAVSDAVIAVSHLSIPLALAVFVLRRRDFPYRRIVGLFALFIALCGLSHLFDIWTLWSPAHTVEAVIKALTAVVSAITAVLLWPLLPKAAAIPSTADLERQNLLLELEIRRHGETRAKLSRLNGELEDRVRDRTADLEAKTLQLEGLRHAAEAANEAKSRFLSMVSHEIRTPLNSVINMSSMLLGKTRDRTDRRYIGTISTASKALLAIVQDILDFSDIEAGQITLNTTPTDIGTVVEDVVESVAARAHERGLDIATHIAPTVPRSVLVDEERVRQVLLSLVGNAVNYTSQGSVQVRVDWQGTAGRGTLAVDVIDTGIGIAPEDQEAIFERFSQVETDRPGAVRGTGLGLSISRRLVTQMGGRISVDSAVGRGSTFGLRLYLDVVEGPDTAAEPFSAVIFGGAETTARLIAEALTDAGGAAEVLPIEATRADAPPVRKDVAMVLAPVDRIDPGACRTACTLARRWADQVVLFLPIGAAQEIRVDLAEAGLLPQTYPVRRRELASLASLNRQVDDATPLDVADLRGLSILVVDDNEDNLFVADHVLSHAGAIVHCVGSGPAALTALTLAAFDCILLDLRMPGMDGFQTARRIRDLGSAGARTTIVALSANMDPATLERLAALGVTEHLAKPFMPETLWRAVQKAVGRTPPTAAPTAAPARHEAPPTDQSDGEPVLDRTVIDQLVEFASAGLVIQRIEPFLAGLPERLDRIATGEVEQRAEAAHTLAGAAGSLGLFALSAECRHLEDAMRNNEAPPSAEALARLSQVADAAGDALSAIRDELDDPSAGQTPD